MSTTRREFLARTGGAATLLASGVTLPGFLTRTARASDRAPADDRVLVIVQLTGGNDGLNTVIPHADDLYHRARPTLGVATDRVHPLTDTLGLHPEMSAFKELYDRGDLSVITNVGYPNPDRSHFRSMDIWHTALTSPEGAPDGWLGRVVDHAPGREHPMAMHLDDTALPLALRTRIEPVPSVRAVDALTLAGSAGELEESIGDARRAATADLLFVQRLALSSCRNAQRLERVAEADVGAGSYPAYGLADRLRQIAQLVGAGFGARVYYTSIGGFDTHARQELSHGPLLRELSESIGAFRGDLDRRGLGDRVLLMTFSEFGRRTSENGSRGTDHGAAAPMFLVGPACRAGVTGGPPDLSRQEGGDVVHTIDFRQVYATILDDWLGVDHRPVLSGRFEKVPVLW